MFGDTLWLDEQAELTLARLLPRLEAATAREPDGGVFLERVTAHFNDAFQMFFSLYSGHYDFFYHLEQTLFTVADAYFERSVELKALDAERLQNPDWFQSETVMGAVCDVERFAGNLAGIRERIPYFEALGLTYLHLHGSPDTDGQEIAALASDLRAHGISLCVDVGFTSNYEDPEVFRAKLGEILFLANAGAAFLMLKPADTDNPSQAHRIMRGFNAIARMAAPALLLESGGIVQAQHVRSYVDPNECPLSYNPVLMVAIWEALATRSTDFLRHTLNKQFALPPGCTWVNYLRTDEAVGWGFADEDAVEVGINAPDHRYFLNLFYLGRFPGSFANGLPYNFDPRTQDMQISGTTASLAGLEKAYRLGDAAYRATALHRIIMIHSLLLSVGGIPLLYLGDETGTLNDYRYRDDPDKAYDSRWAHRPIVEPERDEQRHDPDRDEGQIFNALVSLIELRKATPALADGETYFISTGNPHVMGYTRHNTLLALANFAEFPQQVDVNTVGNEWFPIRDSVDLITGEAVADKNVIQLEAYQFMWLARQS